jgi:hypothetical protein
MSPAMSIVTEQVGRNRPSDEHRHSRWAGISPATRIVTEQVGRNRPSDEHRHSRWAGISPATSIVTEKVAGIGPAIKIATAGGSESAQRRASSPSRRTGIGPAKAGRRIAGPSSAHISSRDHTGIRFRLMNLVPRKTVGLLRPLSDGRSNPGSRHEIRHRMRSSKTGMSPVNRNDSDTR